VNHQLNHNGIIPPLTAITISFPVQTVTGEAVELWADRAMGDFEKKVGKNAPSKQKACMGMFFQIIPMPILFCLTPKTLPEAGAKGRQQHD